MNVFVSVFYIRFPFVYGAWYRGEKGDSVERPCGATSERFVYFEKEIRVKSTKALLCSGRCEFMATGFGSPCCVYGSAVVVYEFRSEVEQFDAAGECTIR